MRWAQSERVLRVAGFLVGDHAGRDRPNEIERNPAGEKKGTGPTCVHRILRDEGNTGPGCGQGSLKKVSVGVLLPVCRTYKSS